MHRLLKLLTAEHRIKKYELREVCVGCVGQRKIHLEIGVYTRKKKSLKGTAQSEAKDQSLKGTTHSQPSQCLCCDWWRCL